MIATILVFGILLYASICDIRTGEIPNRVPLILLGAGVLFILLYKQSFLLRLSGILLVGIALLIIGLVGNLGGGDVKLGASLAFAVSFFPALYILLIAFTTACLFFVVQKIIKKDVKSIPLAPFFAVGFVAVTIVQYINPTFLITL